MKATVFGAGNIGRGLVGLVLHKAGYEVTFVDADADLVAGLVEAGSYEVVTTEGERTRVPVSVAIHAAEADAVVQATANSHLVATAVGEPILKIVAGPIAAALARPDAQILNVLACENAHPNSPLLRRHVVAAGSEPSERVGFPEVVVDRIVSSEPGALTLTAEHAYEFLADRDGWVGPPTDGIDVVAPIEAYIVRKLWLVNGLHAAVAYLGKAAGHAYIHDALADPGIESAVSAIADSMVAALEHRYPNFPAGEFRSTASESLRRFTDPELRDAVDRVARNPVAKLGPDERLMAPARAAHASGVALEPFARVIAAALDVSDPVVVGADELQAQLADGGPKEFLRRQGAPDDLIELIEQMSTEGDDVTTRELTIVNPAGLHARPASLIVETSKGFDAKVEIRKGDKKANAASIMSILALGASTGDTITVSAEGADAEAAVQFIEQLMLATEEPS